MSDEERASGAKVHEYRDVTYAQRGKDTLELNLFVPETSESPPLVIYVHGGCWVLETRDNCPDLAALAEEWEYAIASVSYRLMEVPDDIELPFGIEMDDIRGYHTPRGTFPDNIVDVKAAVRWLRSEADSYGYDAESVALWGASAGGHLACLAAVLDDIEDIKGDVFADETVKVVAPDQSGRVQAVVNWYGPVDIVDLEPAQCLLFGGTGSNTTGKARLASPVTHLSSGDPPFVIMHGREDSLFPVEQSRTLTTALDAAEIDFVFYELHDRSHVFGADTERTAMDALTTAPRPAQSVTATAHTGLGPSTERLVEDVPLAGPDGIKSFLSRYL